MNKLMTAMALVMISTGLAQAAWSRDDFIQSYSAQGYSGVEVRMMGTAAKVQANKDGARVEVFHDIETGAVLAKGGSSGRSDDDDDHHDHDDDGDDDHGRHGPDHD